MMLTVKELAKLLNLNPQTIYRKAEAGVIPYKRVGGEGGAIRFDSVEIDKWIFNNTMKSLKKGARNGRSK